MCPCRTPRTRWPGCSWRSPTRSTGVSSRWPAADPLTKQVVSVTELDGRDWGGPPRMNASEALMWRAEGDLRTRSSGLLLELLDSAPDWDRFLAAHDRATRAIPRLRDRVVEPLLPVVPPTWVPDTRFDLAYHVQRIRLPEPGTPRQLLDYASQ